MGFIAKVRRAKAAYWAAPTPDGLGGNTYPAAIQIDVRWDEKLQEIVDGNGNKVMSTAVVQTDRLCDMTGYLESIPYNDGAGVIGDLTGQMTDPKKRQNAYPIVKRADTPTIRYNDNLYRAWL